MLLTFLIWESGLIPCVETTGTILSGLISMIVFYAFLFALIPTFSYIFTFRGSCVLRTLVTEPRTKSRS